MTVEEFMRKEEDNQMDKQFTNGYVTLPIEAYEGLKARVAKAEATLDSVMKVEVTKPSKYGRASITIQPNREVFYTLALAKLAERPEIGTGEWTIRPLEDMYWYGPEIATGPACVEEAESVTE